MTAKRGQIQPDGVYYTLSTGGRIVVKEGRVIWVDDWAVHEDMGKANKTNIEKAIREARRVEKAVIEHLHR